MDWTAAARSDRGRRRPKNEDAYLARPDRGVFAVADGMGGHPAGDVASRIAIETVRSHLEGHRPDAEPDDAADRVRAAIEAANRAICERGRQDRDKAGMGTTLTVLAVARSGECLAIGHIGDSRAYRLRGGRIEQLTVDHTWVQQQVELGLLPPDQAADHPFGSVLTRALGTLDEVEVDVVVHSVESDDLLLLCSDGLTTHLDDADLAALLTEPDASLDDLADRAVAEANLRGGTDNITLILVRAAA